MLPVISALLAFVAGLFRSRASLCLEHLALRHQLAVYQQTVHRPRLHPTDRLFWAWLSRLWPGWQRCPGVRPAPHGHRLAAPALSRPLAALSQQGTPGRPAVAKEVRELIQDDVAGESDLGLAPDRRGAAETGHRRGQIDGGEVSGATAEAAVANVEDLSEEPRARTWSPWISLSCRR